MCEISGEDKKSTSTKKQWNEYGEEFLSKMSTISWHLKNFLFHITNKPLPQNNHYFSPLQAKRSVSQLQNVNGTKHCTAYLWNPRATGVRSKHLHQGNGKKGETQGPEDVHYVVHDVRTRTLKNKSFSSMHLIYGHH